MAVAHDKTRVYLFIYFVFFQQSVFVSQWWYKVVELVNNLRTTLGFFLVLFLLAFFFTCRNGQEVEPEAVYCAPMASVFAHLGFFVVRFRLILKEHANKKSRLDFL